MRILHTSDWHIGRTFHGHSTVENLRTVLAALVGSVREHQVDVVIVAGDVFDSATPAADYYTVLTDTLRAIRDTGATVVMTSGNHDSAARLGYLSEFASLAGIHIVTRPEQLDQPITLTDEYGPVHVYGIPYLEPALIRHLYPDATLRTHEQTLGFALDKIRADLDARGGRSVVISHCFAVGGALGGVSNSEADAAARPSALPSALPAALPSALSSAFPAALPSALPAGQPATEATDVERDITAGGLDYVPLAVFDGPDYVALGHIHGRSALSDRVRYSGAPLHYSFSEASKPRGSWLVELDAGGLASVDWVPLPVPRALVVLTGTIDELLGDAALAEHEAHWVSAVLTDQVRPMDSMRRLQARYPWCVTLEHRPAFTAPTAKTSYSDRVHKKADHEIVAGFLEHVRNGVGPSSFEHDVLAEVLAEVVAASGSADRAADQAGTARGAAGAIA